MHTHTIHFDHAREAEDVTGRRHDLLPMLQQRLEVKLTARDTWLELNGVPGRVERAVAFFEELRRSRNRGVVLRKHEVLYALRALERDRLSELGGLRDCRIEVASNKEAVFPRTFGQQRYVRMVLEHDLTFGLGPAGTGKTYLAMALAVGALLRADVSRIILTRPAIEAGEALGHLPGDMLAKVMPYLRPLYDALHDMMPATEIEQHMDRGVIEVAPLAYMRGRTLNHSFIILDEAQNTTTEQMLMFLTRLGFDSRCVVTGDLTQVDLPGRKTSGLAEAATMLRGVPGIGFAELDDSDVVRHELVQKIIKAYREGRGRPRHGQGGSDS